MPGLSLIEKKDNGEAIHPIREREALPSPTPAPAPAALILRNRTPTPSVTKTATTSSTTNWTRFTTEPIIGYTSGSNGWQKYGCEDKQVFGVLSEWGFCCSSASAAGSCSDSVWTSCWDSSTVWIDKALWSDCGSGSQCVTQSILQDWGDGVYTPLVRCVPGTEVDVKTIYALGPPTTKILFSTSTRTIVTSGANGGKPTIKQPIMTTVPVPTHLNEVEHESPSDQASDNRASIIGGSVIGGIVGLIILCGLVIPCVVIICRNVFGPRDLARQRTLDQNVAKEGFRTNPVEPDERYKGDEWSS